MSENDVGQQASVLDELNSIFNANLQRAFAQAGLDGSNTPISLAVLNAAVAEALAQNAALAATYAGIFSAAGNASWAAVCTAWAVH